MADTPAQAALREAFNSRLPTSGGTMTGELILNGDPSTNLAAATKQYVDSGLSNISWNSLSGKPNFATVAITGNYNDLVNKPNIPANPKAYVTQTWRSGTEWYRVWSDGWIEQGGHGTGGTCTFNKSFSNTNYTFNVQPSSGETSHPDWTAAYELRSGRTTAKTSLAYYAGGDHGWDWRASGY